MRRFVLAISVLITTTCRFPHQAQTSSTLTFSHVTVVDVTDGRLVPDQDVVVEGNKIVRLSLAASTPSKEGIVIDGKNRFLIPGLWDMHMHLFDVDTPGSPNVTLPLLVANGVTGVRDVGAMLDLMLYWRDQINEGKVIGPRIVGTGPLLDGIPVVYPLMSTLVPTPEDAKRIVDALTDRGVDFVKVYEMVRRDVFLALVSEAQKRNIVAVGHLPLTVDAAEASDAGMKSFEHLRNLELSCSRDADILRKERTELLERSSSRKGSELRTEIHWSQRPRAIRSYDAQKCTDLLARFAKNHTWQVPTLFLNSREVKRPDTVASVRSTLRFVPAVQQADWEAWSSRTAKLTPGQMTDHINFSKWQFDIVKQMSTSGVGMLAGTDVSAEWVVPGFSLHEELRTLVEAGLSPLQALQLATVNPSHYFETENLAGTIQAGRSADLVLLDANPLVEITNTQKIAAVVANGKYFDRKSLDQMLEQAQRAAASGNANSPGRPRMGSTTGGSR